MVETVSSVSVRHHVLPPLSRGVGDRGTYKRRMLYLAESVVNRRYVGVGGVHVGDPRFR